MSFTTLQPPTAGVKISPTPLVVVGSNCSALVRHFRTDRSELRFVNYKTLPDGELELLPDFSYDYGQALQDSTFETTPEGKRVTTPSDKRIVRTAKFHLYDAEDSEQIRWADKGEEFAHKLSDHLPSIYDADCDEDAEKGTKQQGEAHALTAFRCSY